MMEDDIYFKLCFQCSFTIIVTEWGGHWSCPGICCNIPFQNRFVSEENILNGLNWFRIASWYSMNCRSSESFQIYFLYIVDRPWQIIFFIVVLDSLIPAHGSWCYAYRMILILKGVFINWSSSVWPNVIVSWWSLSWHYMYIDVSKWRWDIIQWILVCDICVHY